MYLTWSGMLPAQYAALELLADTGVGEMDVFVNDERITSVPSGAVRLAYLDQEVYGLGVEVTGSRPWRQLVYLRLGDTARFCVDVKNGKTALRPCNANGAEFTDYKLPDVLLYGTDDNPPELKDTVATESNIASDTAMRSKPANWNLYPSGEADGSQQDSVQVQEAEQKKTHLPVLPKISVQEKTDSLSTYCTRSLDSKSLRNLRSKLKIIATPAQQEKLVLRDLEQTCLYVEQLGELFRLIEEDEIKLRLFKALYQRILNVEKRSLLYGQFLFEYSVNEMENYANAQEKR